MRSWIGEWYQRFILKHPTVVLSALVVVVLLSAYQAKNFKVDASGDSLVLENDRDLRYYQEIRERYGDDEYLVVTFTPHGDLFSEENLKVLENLSSDLASLDRVLEVNSILTAPLLNGFKQNFMLLLQGIPTMQKGSVSIEDAKAELLTSPIYRQLLISEDGKTTALQIRFKSNEPFEIVQKRRRELRQIKSEMGLNPDEAIELEEVSVAYRQFHTDELERQRTSVGEIRSVLEKYGSHGTLYLGGVPMIVADMIAFVRKDIVIFGVGVLLFLILTLGIIFRQWRWVFLPILCCIAAVVVMLGFLGWTDWRATVISSNFTSLLLIITMSMAIHLVVRYREWHNRAPQMAVDERVWRTVKDVGLPCFYCALTTMVGFGSLVVSGIRPVIDFGWMMTLGIGLAFLLTFLIFPCALALLPAGEPPKMKGGGSSLTAMFAKFTQCNGGLIRLFAILGMMAGIWGLTNLKVENRFIDYFRKSTEIYKGMEVIDQSLGGTNPLEIIIKGDGADFWLQRENLNTMRNIQNYLEKLPETGKVLSFDSLMQVAESLNGNQPINGFLLSSLRRLLPENIREQVLKPYMSPTFDEARFVMRIRESGDDLQRQQLLTEISSFLSQDMKIKTENYRFSGMYVLYNNMLQSLFQSQIVTMGMVFLAILLMFTVLFRSFKLAIIAIIPNIFPAILVLGAMGALGIPLDMMTITIAAITIGIAVDHTIHYVHRFKREFEATGLYLETMQRCHGSIGKAMYYTSLTIIVGFSILALSNFIPTIYFGLFTGLAMLIALLAALALLPRLLIDLKPLGPERAPMPAAENV